MKTHLRVTFPVIFVAFLVSLAFLPQSRGENFSVPGGERCTATITITDYLGRSVEGVPYQLKYRRGGEDYVLMQSGVLPASGVIEYEGNVLVGGRSNLISLNLTEFNFTVKRFSFSNTQRHIDLSVSTVPAPGDAAPDAELVDLFSGEDVRLSDFRGQVIFVDFWASWCGWCQEPMAENNAVMARRAKDWEGKATIIGLSVNDTASEVRNHIKARGWTHVRHLWDETGAGSNRGKAYATYGMPYVPSSVLIGPDGTILWRGYTGYADPEAFIDRALAGEPILGKSEDTD